MNTARAAVLPLLAAAAAVSGCQGKGATAVVPVLMAPYAAPAVTVSPASNGRAGANGATQATPVAATAMNPAAGQAMPRPATTPIAAYSIGNMPVAATPVVTVPTMVAPAPAPAHAPQYAPAPAATMATPVMMMAPAQTAPQQAGGQVMYMMMVPAQPTPSAAAQAQPVVAAPSPQLMTLPTYGAPVYVMPQPR